MRNAEARLKHWSTGWTAKNQGDSPPTPFYKYMDFFEGKDVLEVGPGEGRQYKSVLHLAKSYAVADISKEVLACPVFDAVQSKYLLKEPGQKLDTQFDLIHFWYVLHHIPSDELESFVNGFLLWNLKESGIVMFNTPYLDFHRGAYANDGVNTTKYTLDQVFRHFDPHFHCLMLDGTLYGQSNGHIYIGRKR